MGIETDVRNLGTDMGREVGTAGHDDARGYILGRLHNMGTPHTCLEASKLITCRMIRNFQTSWRRCPVKTHLFRQYYWAPTTTLVAASQVPTTMPRRSRSYWR